MDYQMIRSLLAFGLAAVVILIAKLCRKPEEKPAKKAVFVVVMALVSGLLSCCAGQPIGLFIFEAGWGLHSYELLYALAGLADGLVFGLCVCLTAMCYLGFVEKKTVFIRVVLPVAALATLLCYVVNMVGTLLLQQSAVMFLLVHFVIALGPLLILWKNLMAAPAAEGEEKSETAAAESQRRKNRRLWALVIVILAIVLLYTGISVLTENNRSVKATVVTNSGKTKQMTLEEIRTVANDNRALFEREYAGAEITVTSKVSNVGSAYELENVFSCDAYIQLDAGEAIAYWFCPVTEEIAETMSLGRTVTVNGTIGPITGNNHLDVYIFTTTDSVN